MGTNTPGAHYGGDPEAKASCRHPSQWQIVTHVGLGGGPSTLVEPNEPGGNVLANGLAPGYRWCRPV